MRTWRGRRPAASAGDTLSCVASPTPPRNTHAPSHTDNTHIQTLPWNITRLSRDPYKHTVSQPQRLVARERKPNRRSKHKRGGQSPCSDPARRPLPRRCSSCCVRTRVRGWRAAAAAAASARRGGRRKRTGGCGGQHDDCRPRSCSPRCCSRARRWRNPTAAAKATSRCRARRLSRRPRDAFQVRTQTMKGSFLCPPLSNAAGVCLLTGVRARSGIDERRRHTPASPLETSPSRRRCARRRQERQIAASV